MADSIIDRTLSKLLGGEYAEQRRIAAEELYNAFADVLNEQRPSIETALYVLEALKANLLRRSIDEASRGDQPSPAAPPEPDAPAQPGKLGWRDAKKQAQETEGKKQA